MSCVTAGVSTAENILYFSEAYASIYQASKPPRGNCAAFLAGNLMGRYPGYFCKSVQKGNLAHPRQTCASWPTQRDGHFIYCTLLNIFFFSSSSFHGVSISTSISIRSSSFPGDTTCAKLKCRKIVKSVWKLTIWWETEKLLSRPVFEKFWSTFLLWFHPR